MPQGVDFYLEIKYLDIKINESPVDMPQNPQLGTHLFLVLFKAFEAVRAHDQKSVAATGLCVSDFATLEVLLHKGPLPVNAIGQRVLLTSGSITTAVDRLEKKGLVRRESSTSDRRIRMVHLTREGQSLIEGIFERHQQALALATSGVTDEENKILIGLLKKLGMQARQLLEN